MFNYFNPSEKTSSNDRPANDGENHKLKQSISTPDIRMENPFNFKIDSASVAKKSLSTPVLMIFIIGGVTPSEIRYVVKV